MNFLDMGIMEIVVILLVAILIFGPGRIPEIGRNIGRGLRAFRKMTGGLAKEFTQALDAEDKASGGKPTGGGGLDRSLDKLEKGAKTLDKFLKDTDKKKDSDKK